ncbi:MAG: ATP-binding protein [Labedaea sp.]
MQKPRTWHINGWGLRTKVSVVLLLPAIVALVLGGLRVVDQLDDAHRLSTLRDQVVVLRTTTQMASRVADETVGASVEPKAREAQASAVDKQYAELKRASDATELPEDVQRTLRASAGDLDAARKLAGPGANPGVVVTEYYNLVNNLAAVPPSIVTRSGKAELEGPGRAVESLLRLRGILSIEQAVLILYQNGAPLNVGTGQRTTNEEVLNAERARRDLPADKLQAFEETVKTVTVRRTAFAAADANPSKVSPQALLPDLKAESQALDKLLGELLDRLDSSASSLASQASTDALRDSTIVLVSLLAALVLALVVGRSLLVPLRTLRSAALNVAHRQLPDTVERVRAGERVDWSKVEPVPVHTNEEVGQLGRAFDEMHLQAVRLAGEQADLRHQVADMFTTLSRRSQSLVELQLEALERLESDEQDPKRLEELFQLDHLATRLRRNGENLQVLAGGTPARRGQGAVTVVELLRAAISEMKDYRRVNLGQAPTGQVRSPAGADVVHLLAELLDNAARYSPPEEKVTLTADRASDGGLLVRVIDTGIGMPPDELAAANKRLAAGEEVGPETTRRMGLFVVSRLAERHGVKVRLRATHDGNNRPGVTASVHIPAAHVDLEAPAPSQSVAVNGTSNGFAAALPAGEVPSRDWFTPMTEPEPPAHLPDRPSTHRQSEGLPSRRPAAAARSSQPAPPPPAQPAATWTASAPEWSMPQPAANEPPGPSTSAGLPMRKPGAKLAPSSAGHEPAHALQRDPASIRSNLARHHSGVRTARTRAQGTDDAGTAGQFEGEA